MKKSNKTTGIILLVANIILVLVCCFFYFKADRTAPKITFQVAELTYSQNMDQAKLLENITAVDNEDGDITDRIVIEKIVLNKEAGKAIVFYAVSDTAGNAAKDSREFPAVFSSLDTEKLEEAPQDILPTPSPASEDVLPTPTATAEPTPTATPQPTPTPEATATPQPEEEEQEPEEAEQEPVPPVPISNTAAPTISLKTSEATTKVGSGPAWVNIIQALTDDKDSYETLFHNLSVSKYNVNQAGTYQVTLSTEDSDGNKSNAVPFTIHVK